MPRPSAAISARPSRPLWLKFYDRCLTIAALILLPVAYIGALQQAALVLGMMVFGAVLIGVAQELRFVLLMLVVGRAVQMALDLVAARLGRRPRRMVTLALGILAGAVIVAAPIEGANRRHLALIETLVAGDRDELAPLTHPVERLGFAGHDCGVDCLSLLFSGQVGEVLLAAPDAIAPPGPLPPAQATSDKRHRHGPVPPEQAPAWAYRLQATETCDPRSRDLKLPFGGGLSRGKRGEDGWLDLRIVLLEAMLQGQCLVRRETTMAEAQLAVFSWTLASDRPSRGTWDMRITPPWTSGQRLSIYAAREDGFREVLRQTRVEFQLAQGPSLPRWSPARQEVALLASHPWPQTRGSFPVPPGRDATGTVLRARLGFTFDLQRPGWWPAARARATALLAQPGTLTPTERSFLEAIAYDLSPNRFPEDVALALAMAENPAAPLLSFNLEKKPELAAPLTDALFTALARAEARRLSGQGRHDRNDTRTAEVLAKMPEELLWPNRAEILALLDTPEAQHAHRALIPLLSRIGPEGIDRLVALVMQAGPGINSDVNGGALRQICPRVADDPGLAQRMIAAAETGRLDLRRPSTLALSVSTLRNAGLSATAIEALTAGFDYSPADRKEMQARLITPRC